MNNKYVLAMYDVRGKQDFIFRTNKIKEIVGGSCIIRDCFKDFLFPAAIKYAKENPQKVDIPVANRAKDGKNVIYNYMNIEEQPGEVTDTVETPVVSAKELTEQITQLQKRLKKEKDKAEKKRLDKELKSLKKQKETLKRNDEKQQKETERATSGKFTVSGFAKHIGEEGFLGEVVYEGGGNFFVLYKDTETCVGINRIFTREVLKNIGTLKVLCTHIEVDSNLRDWGKDSRLLREKHRLNEAQGSAVKPFNGTTLTAVDPNNSMPLVEDLKNLKEWRFSESREHFGVEGRVSRECFAKLCKYFDEQKERGDEYGEKILDNLVKDEEDSLLAVVYIDGNGMGAYVEKCMQDQNGNELSPDYETRINKLRETSQSIQQKYVKERKEAIEKRLTEKYPESQKSIGRFVVFAGDEMNFIVKAKDALDAVEAYFSVDDNGRSQVNSCAGIAIFHSHAPYAEAYRIAEACCESGKKHMKDYKETDTCYLDYQYCQSGLGRDLDTIRELENGDLISKPWLVNWDKDRKTSTTLKEIRQVVNDLNALGARSNVKILAERAKRSLVDFDLEMERIYAHQPKEIQDKVNYLFKEISGEHRRSMVYDIVIAYDLWFRPSPNAMIAENEV